MFLEEGAGKVCASVLERAGGVDGLGGGRFGVCVCLN